MIIYLNGAFYNKLTIKMLYGMNLVLGKNKLSQFKIYD